MAVVKRTKRLCIEDLANEIFYEIFDYLDGCHIYDSFSNLNTRFQHLLINSYLLLKINLCSNHQILLEHYCLNIINPNKRQIISLNLSKAKATKQFLMLINIDSLFNHLQSLIINGIVEHKLQQLLARLVSLPCLRSLNILVIDHLESFDTIYQLIFRLPLLEYNKLCYGPWIVPVTLAIAKDEQFSSIEHLHIDTYTTLNELIAILSYTPQLRRLTCGHLCKSNMYISEGNMLTLPYLTHVYIDRCSLQFDDFKLFIEKISSRLQVLRLSTSDNIDFLDADLWQNLILQYIPHLRKFDFEYKEDIPNDFQLNLYHQQINRFTSSFWIERQWYFQLETDAPHYINNRIIYSIHSYKKKLNSLVSTSQDIELIAINRCDSERYKLFIKNISPIFQLVRITCLNMNLYHSSNDLLIEFMNHLPNLHSLSVSCLSLELDIPSDINKNKISKVILENMVELKQVHFLIDLCPHMEYLQVGCRNDFDLKVLIRSILMKSNTEHSLQLRSLCLDVPAADETIIQHLRNMIDLEKLLADYSIKRVFDKIYFQWK